MRRAFIDTTILADALLKSGPTRALAHAAIRRFTTSDTPVYAIKEFKRGVLSYYAYLHNKLVTTGNYRTTLRALAALASTPRRNRLSSSLEALGHMSIAGDMGGLADKYGRTASPEEVLTAESRIALKPIFYSWGENRSKECR